MTNLKTIEFTTEKGGVKPSVRSQMQTQGIQHLGLDLTSLTPLANGQYGLPLAIDKNSNDVVYLKLDLSVGFETKPKTRKSKSKVSEPVEVPNLFD